MKACRDNDAIDQESRTQLFFVGKSAKVCWGTTGTPPLSFC